MGITTKYGNYYTTSDWNEMMEERDENDARIEADEAKMDGLEKYLRRQLEEIGFAPEAVGGISYLFRNFTFPISDAQIPDATKKAAVDDLWKRWEKATEFYT